MNQEQIDYLRKCKIALYPISDLRTYPNGKNMTLIDAKTLNYIGKTTEFLNYALGKLIDGKIKEKRRNLVMLGYITAKIEEM